MNEALDEYEQMKKKVLGRRRDGQVSGCHSALADS